MNADLAGLEERSTGSRRSLAWTVCFSLIVLIWAVGISQLFQAHRAALVAATERASSRSFLVAEWVDKSFDLAQYVLQETATRFQPEDLVYPVQKLDQHQEHTDWLVERVERTPNLVFLGMLDRECIVTHTSIGINLGFDALKNEREYCMLALEEPRSGFRISNMFVSVDGTMNVTISYPLLSDQGKLQGFALAGLNLGFFQQWLDLLELSPRDVVTIYDSNSIILARKPFIEESIGSRVVEEHLNRIAETGYPRVFTHRLVSPVDGTDRVWSLRKIGDLPFVVVVGEQTTTAIGSWRKMAFMYLIAGALISLLLVFGTTGYVRSARQASALHQLATRDPLTGLWNRRYFTDIAENILASARRRGTPITLIMMDLDHFKRVNDTFGHDIGDQVIKAAAYAMQSTFRQGDIMARWGGEEFILLLDDSEIKDASAFAERLRTHVSALTFDVDLRITCSQGVAQLHEGESLGSLIKRADDALYLAKKQGRNRFEVST